MVKKSLFNIKFSMFKILLILAFFLTWHPMDVKSETIWSGDFETGDFSQWHLLGSTTPNFSQIPTYGRPVPYGDGSLLEIVTNPVRHGTYAAKFTVKNSINGSEPDDCDIPFPTCTQRRTELTGQATLPLIYDAMPYMSERWISISHFIPTTWANVPPGFGIIAFQLKPLNEYGRSSTISIKIINGTWRLEHRWSGVQEPTAASIPWQQQMYYDATYPKLGVSPTWDDGVADFVSPSSQAALGSLNKGGWTDWIIHVKFDERGAGSGGTGFLKIWKRENSDAWIHILDIRPKVISRGGMTFDRGIGFHVPPHEGKYYSGLPNTGGYGIKAGMYMDKNQVWGLANNRVIYLDNVKIANEHASFNIMSPDALTPGLPGPITPPKIVDVSIVK